MVLALVLAGGTGCGTTRSQTTPPTAPLPQAASRAPSESSPAAHDPSRRTAFLPAVSQVSMQVPVQPPDAAPLPPPLSGPMLAPIPAPMPRPMNGPPTGPMPAPRIVPLPAPDPDPNSPAGGAPEVLPLPLGMGDRSPTLPERSPADRLQNLIESADPSAENFEKAPLSLEQLMGSVVQQFPLVLSALEEQQIASGRAQAAQGAFDLKVAAESMNLAEGFYENYRHAVKAEQATWMGGSLYGQYRLGDGDFQPWYKERETNEGGELKVGWLTPLLRGREIDERRAEIMKADLDLAAAEPIVQQQVLEALSVASYVYWSWVAAGQNFMVTQELLEVAKNRQAALARQVELENIARVELMQNERLIASREAKLVEAKRKLQAAAIKLSLFLRDPIGNPIIPSVAELPPNFPPIDPALHTKLETDIASAIDIRPEIRQLALARESVSIDLAQGNNDLMPNLSTVIEVSKDVGAKASSSGDKTPLELEAGLVFDMPVQRNKASGKIRASQAKLSQLAIKQQFTMEKIATEVQDAHSARDAAIERLAQTRENVRLARELVNAEYRSFELGNSDVLRIAIQEAAELDAQQLEIEAIADYFQATAQLRIATGEPLRRP